MKSTKSSHDSVITPQVISKAVITGMTNKASWSCSSTMAQRNWPSGRRPMMTNLRGTSHDDGVRTRRHAPDVRPEVLPVRELGDDAAEEAHREAREDEVRSARDPGDLRVLTCTGASTPSTRLDPSTRSERPQTRKRNHPQHDTSPSNEGKAPPGRCTTNRFHALGFQMSSFSAAGSRLF